jgi:hypothetical protein
MAEISKSTVLGFNISVIIEIYCGLEEIFDVGLLPHCALESSSIVIKFSDARSYGRCRPQAGNTRPRGSDSPSLTGEREAEGRAVFPTVLHL